MIDDCSDPVVNQVDDQTEWFGFDTENDDKGKVTLAALISESGAHTVWKKAGPFTEWLEYRSETKKPTTVICHNLEYDLVNELGPDKFSELSLNYLKGRLISARYGSIRLLDSFNHFRMSLMELGKALGIEKKEMDIYSSEYVTTDAWICLKSMTQARDYIASLNGKIGATSGSSSMSVWASMTDEEFFTGPHDSPWLRKGYYGGRTEIFRRLTEGKQVGIDAKGEPILEASIRGYDINSMYPFCMLNDFPEYFLDDPHFGKAKGMAEVTISVPKDLYVAPLCWRAPSGQLLYPIGVIRGVWTYDEIRLAESLGAKVMSIHKALGGNTLVRPFDQFIHTLYAKRKASTNEAERLFLKVLMNSLYGKIASRNQVTRTVSRHSLIKNNSKRIDEVKWITYHRGLLDYFTPQQAYVNVMWGSMITAYSRILLCQHMLKVPPEKLIYADTDSVYTFEHEIPVSDELGDMKLEKTASRMKVVQPKAYMLDDFYRAKGVPRPRPNKDGIMVDYAEQYIEKGFTDFQAPIRFRASLNSHRGRANEWVTHRKSMKSGYSAKTLSGDRYFPPAVGEQLTLTVQKKSYKPKDAQQPDIGHRAVRGKNKHVAAQYVLPL